LDAEIDKLNVKVKKFNQARVNGGSKRIVNSHFFLLPQKRKERKKRLFLYSKDKKEGKRWGGGRKEVEAFFECAYKVISMRLGTVRLERRYIFFPLCAEKALILLLAGA
jgi:hypothetical protein